jgi:hypothetical protein
VGTWQTCALILLQYVVVAVEGMVMGLQMHYRSLLLSAAQDVAAAALVNPATAAAAAATAAAAGGGAGARAEATAAAAAAAAASIAAGVGEGGSAASASIAAAAAVASEGVKRLTRVVGAVLVTEMVRVVAKDLHNRLHVAGRAAMRKRLEGLLAEQLLARDLESCVCARWRWHLISCCPPFIKETHSRTRKQLHSHAHTRTHAQAGPRNKHHTFAHITTTCTHLEKGMIMRF